MGRFTLLPPAIQIHTASEAAQALRLLHGCKWLAVDTETTGLSRPKDRAIILALSDGVNRWAVWPQAIPYFEKILQDPTVNLIFHNANYDCWMLQNIGIDVYKYTPRKRYRVYDTLVMHALYCDYAPHGLKEVTKEFLDITMVEFTTIFDVKNSELERQYLTPSNYAITANYASLDAYATYKVFNILWERLAGITCEGFYDNLLDFYLQSELPFTRVLYSLERAGVKINSTRLVELGSDIERKMQRTARWFAKELNSLSVNPASNAEMVKLFFGKLGKTPLSFTDGGAPQLNKFALTKWKREGCKYAEALLHYRESGKEVGTYVDNLMGLLVNGRVHASFNQAGARTGRLSSSAPNLQNQAPFIREAYEAGRGCTLLALDYDQLEMRILAHMCGEPALVNAIHKDQDVHCSAASLMYKTPYADIKRAKDKDDNDEPLTDEDVANLKKRKASKTIQFGLVYGQGAGKLAATLGISRNEAKATIQRYFNNMPGVKNHFNRIIPEAKEKLFCSTLLGRQRHVPGFTSYLGGDRSQAERLVKNSPIQGSAADIARSAMIKIYEDQDIANTGTRMLIQVHDEIVFEVPNEFKNDVEFNERLRQHMAHPFEFDLKVPLGVSGKYSETWKGCK